MRAPLQTSLRIAQTKGSAGKGIFHRSQAYYQREHYFLFDFVDGGGETVNENDFPRLDVDKVPISVKATLAQTLFKAINLAFQDPEVQEDYQRWKAERSRHERDTNLQA